MDNVFLSLALGILGSLVASVVFLLVMVKFLKPTIKISEEIACVEIDGKRYFGFKIVNTSKYPMFNIRFELEHCKPVYTGNSENRNSTKLSLRRDHLLHVPGFRARDIKALYAIIIFTSEDLDTKIDEQSFVSLSVVASHSLSGATRIFRKDFGKNTLKKGRHKSGDNYQVLNG